MVNWFLTRVPRQFNGERIFFSTNGVGTPGYPHVKERSQTSTWRHTTNQLKMDQRPITAKTIKLLEENTGVHLCDLGICNDIKSTSSAIKNRLSIFNFISCLLIDSIKIKLKTLVPQKTSSRKWKNNPQDGRDHLDVVCYLHTLYKEFLKFSNRKATQSLKWANDRNRPSSEEDVQMDNKHIKIINIFSHWGNQNHSELSFHIH